MKQNLSRDVIIHICKDGTISFRRKGEPIFNGRALPVFSVDTEEQAREIQILFGRNQYIQHPEIPGQAWFKWTDFSGNADDLDAVTEKIRRVYWDNPKRKGWKPPILSFRQAMAIIKVLKEKAKKTVCSEVGTTHGRIECLSFSPQEGRANWQYEFYLKGETMSQSAIVRRLMGSSMVGERSRTIRR